MPRIFFYGVHWGCCRFALSEKSGACRFFAFYFWFLSWCIRGVALVSHFFFGFQKGSEKESEILPLWTVGKVRSLPLFCFLFLVFVLVYSGRCPRSPLPFWCPKRKRKRHRRLRRLFFLCFSLFFFVFPYFLYL